MVAKRLDWTDIAQSRFGEVFSLKRSCIKRWDAREEKKNPRPRNNVFLAENYDIGNENFVEAVAKYLPATKHGEREANFYSDFSYMMVGPIIYSIETIKIEPKERYIEVIMENAQSPLKILSTLINEREDLEFVAKQRHLIAKQIAENLSYLHDEEIIHGDAKLDNFLSVKRDLGDWVISSIVSTDFQHTYCYDEYLERLFNRRNKGCKLIDGTPGYIPPEMFIDGFDFLDYNPVKAEIYAYGVTLYTLMQGGQPENLCSNDPIKHSQIMSQSDCNKHFFKDLILTERDRTLLSLIYRCTDPRPLARPESFNEILNELEQVIYN